VITAGTDTVLTAFKPDGGWWWRYPLEGSSRCSPLVGSDGTVYGASDSMDMHAIRNNVPLGATTWPMFRGNPQHTGRVMKR
jgi:outer membrane protein assembly factor BamB